MDWEARIGRRLTLRDLHILSAVVRWGSMAKAASHLAMSQSAVSEAIAQLEDAVRIRLLDRTPRGIAPTVYAETLLKRGNAVFDELQQAIKDIEFLADPTVGEVRIACPDFLSTWLLPSAIDRLSRRYPQVVVHVVQPNTATLEFRDLHERIADIVLARVPHGFKSDDVDVEALFVDRHFVVAGKSSPWVKRRKVSLTDLIDEPWIIFPSPLINSVLKDVFGRVGLKPPSERVNANSIVLRMHLLATGRFLSLLAQSVLQSAVQKWPIKVLPIDLASTTQPIAVLTLKHRAISPVAQGLIEELRAVAKSMPSPSKIA